MEAVLEALYRYVEAKSKDSGLANDYLHDGAEMLDEFIQERIRQALADAGINRGH